MSYTAIENNTIVIDLTQAALTTGWSLSSDASSASHISCNAGSLTLINYTFLVGHTYRYTYQLSITSGYIQTNFGSAKTVSGLIDETVVATSSQMYFYANGNCTISNFSVELDEETLDSQAQNTVALSEKLGKWTSFYTKAPDSAFSMFTKTYEFKDGNAYVQENGTPNRCNFFGVQYPATIWFSTNEQPTLSKKYIGVNYQANQLLTTTPSGINTSHGEVSELINVDFVQQTLTDGVVTITQYDDEGLYSAPFMRSFPDLVNGNTLIGNWLQMSLQTSSSSNPLNLFTTEIKYVHSYQNIR